MHATSTQGAERHNIGSDEKSAAQTRRRIQVIDCAAMRLLLALLLAVFIVSNAAYAVDVEICDTLERSTSDLSRDKDAHADHWGHHSHTHDIPTTERHDSDKNNGQAHGHYHVHPSFASLLAGDFLVPLLSGCSPAPQHPTASPLSAILPRLERPPKAPLA
ncbi:MAG TPA: hypothetical protein VJ001_16470 [Rhodocyclaceae bacterium]|nr:hypothetical protein [Rhodocyclaceae bacterium]